MTTLTYGYVQKDNDQIGTDLLRSKSSVNPLGFRPTLTHTARKSANGANLNQTIETIAPVVRLVDGLSVSSDAFKATFKYSALQNIVNDAERFEAFDALIAYVIANREGICNGVKNASSSDFTFTSEIV